MSKMQAAYKRKRNEVSLKTGRNDIDEISISIMMSMKDTSK